MDSLDKIFFEKRVSLCSESMAREHISCSSSVTSFHRASIDGLHRVSLFSSRALGCSGYSRYSGGYHLGSIDGNCLLLASSQIIAKLLHLELVVESSSNVASCNLLLFYLSELVDEFRNAHETSANSDLDILVLSDLNVHLLRSESVDSL